MIKIEYKSIYPWSIRGKNNRPNPKGWYRQTDVRKDRAREARNATYQAGAKRETARTVPVIEARQGDKNILVYRELPENRSTSKGLLQSR
jgi:hypothetical protein